MTNSGLEFDPYDYYKDMLRDEAKAKAQEIIENLASESNTDCELNKKLVTEAKKLETSLGEHKSKRRTFNNLRIVLWIVFALGLMFALVGGYSLVNGDYGVKNILYLIFGVIFGIGSLVLILKVLNKKIKEAAGKISKLEKSYREAKNKALASLAALKNKLNFKQYVDFVNNLDTSIKLDYEVDLRKIKTLQNVYSLNLDFDSNESIVDIYSGSIYNNPFIRVLLNKMDMVNHVYTGERIVTWTERVRDSEGRTHTVTHTETLFATHTAPVPDYSNYSVVIYGNGAAPSLSFSRKPSGLAREHDDKDVERLVDKRSKDIEDLAKKAVSKGKNFTALANNKFDALFYAIDRDNEREFRLLFTPLAQQNMVELITAHDTYGDDFNFYKRKQLNFIMSSHSQRVIRFNYTTLDDFLDYEELKNTYIRDMSEAFYSLYFDLAPLLAIPLYQMDEANLYAGVLEKEEITIEEAEALANHMDKRLFRHPQGVTDQILKLKRNHNFNNSDTFSVVSHSFSRREETILVPTLCRNGRMYDVLVRYYVYEPVIAEKVMAVSKLKDTDKKTDASFNRQSYRYHNFVSCLAGDEGYDNADDIAFANYINMHYNKV